ncbi:hypothetical protein CWO04_16225 [Vibrio splendidus]|uniref:hypothetical protein n=1 Tax=Vibrio splendidus TaxID=29497 RepID=UPI000D36590E|nr:hypothetical protein [Vibrio splendidus]PTP83897.1 hypothetical protein CWO04_16225 [Vibrio splendidus]
MAGIPILTRKWALYLQAAQGTIIGIFLGIAGVLMTVNSYKSEIDETKVNLLREQHLLETKLLEFKNAQHEYLNELKQEEQAITSRANKIVSEFTESQNKMQATILELETYLREERRFQAYYDDTFKNITLPSANAALKQIASSSSSLRDRNALLQLMFQRENKFVAEKASEKYLDVMLLEDIDFLVKTFASELNGSYRFNQYTFISELGKKMNHSNVMSFEKALIKYSLDGKNDYYVESLVEYFYRKHLDKEFSLSSLNRLHSHFEQVRMTKSKDQAMLYIMEIQYK